MRRFVLTALMLTLLCACSTSTAEEGETPAPSPGLTQVTATRDAAPTSAVISTPVPSPPASIATATATAPSTPASTSPAVPLIRGPTTGRAVALTFDAGADRGSAALILDTLAREGVKAGFGMTGQWANQHADLVKRMGADGHVFINHTYSHGSFTGLSTASRPTTRAERFAELDRTEEVIQAITGLSTRPFFRPPYGDYDASVNVDVGLRGYSSNVLWTIDSRGWMGLPAAEIAQRCLSLAEPGAIYVFHVGAASADAQALPAIISGLRSQGYEIVQFSSFVR